jgi:hypothetical protein
MKKMKEMKIMKEINHIKIWEERLNIAKQEN